MRYNLSTLTVISIFFMIHGIQGINWIDDDEETSSDIDTLYQDDSDQYLTALTRDQEQEIHSPFITGYKYVSGGAGEGQQHLHPNGEIPNHPEVKTDEELSSFCDPPNPCPLDFENDDCDASSMSAFTAEYSKLYQSEQNCQCDNDHEQCSSKSLVNNDKLSNNMLKRSRRVRRNTRSKQSKDNATKVGLHHHESHRGQTLHFHVAKKSPNTNMF